MVTVSVSVSYTNEVPHLVIVVVGLVEVSSLPAPHAVSADTSRALKIMVLFLRNILAPFLSSFSNQKGLQHAPVPPSDAPK